MSAAPALIAVCAVLLDCCVAAPRNLRVGQLRWRQRMNITWTSTGAGVAQYAQEGRTPLTVRLDDPGVTNYALTGEVLLPQVNASLAIQVGVKERGDSKKITPAVSTRVILLRDGHSVRAGHRRGPTVAKLDDPTTEWLPFEAGIMLPSSAITIGTVLAATGNVTEGGGACVLTLANGAKVRNLRLTAYGNYSPMMAPALIGHLANVALTGEVTGLGDGLAVESGALLTGLLSANGVPFHVTDGPKQALDVSKSMSGVKEPFRVRYGYQAAGSLTKNGRLCFKVAADQYVAMRLLAFSIAREGHVPRLTIRVGYFGNCSAIFDDTVVHVPDLLDAEGAVPEGQPNYVIGRMPLKLTDGRMGYVYQLRVPMAGTANVREVGERAGLDVEFTRDVNPHVNVPDPNEFGEMPAGRPSSVVVLAATMERSPIAMTYRPVAPGNIFWETDQPSFKLVVTNRTAIPYGVTAFAECRGPGTGSEHGIEPKSWTVTAPLTLAPNASGETVLELKPEKRGWYSCRVGVKAGREVVQARETTFAVLAPDTRKAMAGSPFGVWCFFGSHNVVATETLHDDLGAIMLKGGWRWTYGGGLPGPKEDPYAAYQPFKQKYKVTFTIKSPAYGYQRGKGWYDEAKMKTEVIPGIKKALKGGYDNHFKVLHESRSSTSLLRRYSEFLGGQPYDMPSDEQARLEEQMENVRKFCRAIKEAVPQAKIVLINDYPAVGIEYMKRGFPADAFDVFGSEGAMFMRQPERQPDWLCLTGHIQQWKRAMKQYGYDKPLWTSEALYHGTNPGNLGFHEQGVTAVREAILALAGGIERMCAAGCLKDSSDDYHWSNWGASGYLFRSPELNPKPSYAMYAWLTQILDQAKYAGYLASDSAVLHATSDSTVLHVLDLRKPDGSHVYPVWVVTGRQEVALKVEDDKGVVYDAFGNTLSVAAKDGQFVIEASDTPVYVTGTVVESVAARKPIEIARDLGEVILDFGDTKSYEVATKPNTVVESNWDTPRIRGDFRLEPAAGADDVNGKLRVELRPDGDPRKLLPRYVELVLRKPIELAGRPLALTVRAKGNGGWGRVMFELVDAEKRVWTSCGNQYPGACNASDNKGHSFFSFDGWHTIAMPLPALYPGDDQSIYRLGYANWWPTNTPEDIERESKYEQAKRDYGDARKEYEQQLEEYERALADHTAAVAAQKARQAAMTAHADAVKKAKAESKPAPPAPAAPAKPGPAPAKPKEPREPRPPRNYGHAPVTYPLTLTKVIVTMRPHILYIDEERAVENRVVYLGRMGVVRDE